jgi:hypothetical protein
MRLQDPIDTVQDRNSGNALGPLHTWQELVQVELGSANIDEIVYMVQHHEWQYLAVGAHRTLDVTAWGDGVRADQVSQVLIPPGSHSPPPVASDRYPQIQIQPEETTGMTDIQALIRA